MLAILKDKKIIARDTLAASFGAKETLSFLPGQYLTMTIPQLKYSDSRGNNRIFSIVSTPQESGLITIATRLTGSGFKKTLAEMALGEEVEISNVGGDFILPAETGCRLAFIAGGIGITPFMSMIKYVAAEKTGHRIVLIYSNRNRGSTAFFDELTELAKNNPNIEIVFTMTEEKNWPGEKRKISANLISDLTNPRSDCYMIAGPAAMVEAAVGALVEIGVPPERIKKENFTGYEN